VSEATVEPNEGALEGSLFCALSFGSDGAPNAKGAGEVEGREDDADAPKAKGLGSVGFGSEDELPKADFLEEPKAASASSSPFDRFLLVSPASPKLLKPPKFELALVEVPNENPLGCPSVAPPTNFSLSIPKPTKPGVGAGAAESVLFVSALAPNAKPGVGAGAAESVLFLGSSPLAPKPPNEGSVAESVGGTAAVPSLKFVAAPLKEVEEKELKPPNAGVLALVAASEPKFWAGSLFASPKPKPVTAEGPAGAAAADGTGAGASKAGLFPEETPNDTGFDVLEAESLTLAAVVTPKLVPGEAAGLSSFLIPNVIPAGAANGSCLWPFLTSTPKEKPVDVEPEAEEEAEGFTPNENPAPPAGAGVVPAASVGENAGKVTFVRGPSKSFLQALQVFNSHASFFASQWGHLR